MAAPAFGTAGTYLTGAGGGATANVPVPASVASGDVILVGIYKESTATMTTVPTGFTQCTNSPANVTGTHAHQLHVYWKRATGADSGTYDFAWTGNAWREAVAIRITGAVSTGDPTDVSVSAVRTTTTTGATPAVSGTTGSADQLLVWFATNFTGGAWTPPSGWTERVDTGADLTCATNPQTAQGATGSITGTCASNGGSAAILVSIKSTSGSAPSAPVYPVSQYGSFH